MNKNKGGGIIEIIEKEQVICTHCGAINEELTPYELDVALAKRKILYEKQYPETKHGAYMIKERKKGQKTLPKKSITAKSSSIDSLNLEGDGSEPPISFAKSIVEITNSSEHSIRDKIQVGKAILNKEYDEKTIELFKEGKISHSKILRKQKKLKNAKNKKDRLKKKIKAIKKDALIVLKQELPPARIAGREF